MSRHSKNIELLEKINNIDKECSEDDQEISDIEDDKTKNDYDLSDNDSDTDRAVRRCYKYRRRAPVIFVTATAASIGAYYIYIYI